MTQRARILDYMEQFGRISPMEAFMDLGITKLATRISEMKADGFEFHSEYMTSKNRFGTPVRYMRYWLEKRPDAATPDPFPKDN